MLSESIALAEAHGSTVTLDGDFARDLEDIINSHREPLNPPAWDCSSIPAWSSPLNGVATQ